MVVGATVSGFVFTRISVFGIDAGINVLAGNVRMMSSPIESAPADPVVNLIVYDADALIVVGLIDACVTVMFCVAVSV